MVGLGLSVRTTVSPVPLSVEAEPHIVRKGAELTVSVAVNGDPPPSHPLTLVAELVDEEGALVPPTAEAQVPLGSVTSYVLRPGTTSATLRPRINVLSSAFTGSDAPFRIRLRAANDPSVAPVLSPKIVVRSKWPAKSKRDTPASALAETLAVNVATAVSQPTSVSTPLAPVVPSVLVDGQPAPGIISQSHSLSGSDSQGGPMDMRQIGEVLTSAAAERTSGRRSRADSHGSDAPVGSSGASAVGLGLGDAGAQAEPSLSVEPVDIESVLHLLESDDSDAALQAILAMSADGLDGGLFVDAMPTEQEAAQGPPPMAAGVGPAGGGDGFFSSPAGGAAQTSASAPCAGASDGGAATAPPPRPAGGGMVRAVIPPRRERQRSHDEVNPAAPAEHEEEPSDAFNESLEASRRKRRPINPPKPLPLVPKTELPGWLERASLCRSSGFLCLDCVLADPQPPAMRLLKGRAEYEGAVFKVRWCSANMNQAMDCALDRLCAGQELPDLVDSAAHARLGAASEELAHAEVRSALDCGMMSFAVGDDEQRARLELHVMLHTDGAPKGSISVRRLFLLARVHAHALGEHPPLAFKHPCACEAPAEAGDVVKRVFCGRLIYSSPSTHELCGYHPWEFLGREAGCTVHPDDAQRWYKQKIEISRKLQAEPAKPVDHHFTYRHVHRQRSWVWVSSHTRTTLSHQRLPPRRPSSQHEALVAALQEVMIRMRAVDVPSGNADVPPAPMTGE